MLTPIIAVTAHAIHGYTEKCIENDMDDYITKPLRKKLIIDLLGNWIIGGGSRTCGYGADLPE